MYSPRVSSGMKWRDKTSWRKPTDKSWVSVKSSKRTPEVSRLMESFANIDAEHKSSICTKSSEMSLFVELSHNCMLSWPETIELIKGPSIFWELLFWIRAKIWSESRLIKWEILRLDSLLLRLFLKLANLNSDQYLKPKDQTASKVDQHYS